MDRSLLESLNKVKAFHALTSLFSVTKAGLCVIGEIEGSGMKFFANGDQYLGNQTSSRFYIQCLFIIILLSS